jgi:ABC-type antimicrobial peptide transport system permease subunit
VSRKKQYGVLRAIGMKRGQMLRMILLELYEIYAVSVPIGVFLGVAIALLISRLSGDVSKNIYLNNERISFSTVIPDLQIGFCILVIALFVGFVGYFSGRKISRSLVPSLLSNGDSDSNSKHTLNSPFFRLGERYGRTFTLFSLGCKYILKDKRTSIFVILTICVGTVLFTGLSYQKEIAVTYREDTKEMNYLNGQYEMGSVWVSSALEGIDRDCAKKIESLKGVSSVKTAAGLPIRVVDDKSIKRNDAYYNDLNNRLLKYHRDPIAGYDGTDQIYKSILYGYNKTALNELKKYVIAGDYDISGLKDDEIILSVLHMEKQSEYPGSYKEGTPLMRYQVGDKIRMKYRADFNTNQEAYETFVDSKAKYIYKTYKVVAIVSFAYIYDCNRIVYPLLITNDKQIQKLCPDSHIHRMNIDGDNAFTKSKQEQLELQLIQLGNQNYNISTRSMISDIHNNELLYQKQMVYVIGIVIVAFILVLINIINNLNYRMQTRTREICMFRAIGMSVKMIRRMMIFENGLLGMGGVVLGYIIAHPVLRYLYKQSDMKAFAHGFQFNYRDFFLISFITILICVMLSVRLSKDWKTKQIMEQIEVVK